MLQSCFQVSALLVEPSCSVQCNGQNERARELLRQAEGGSDFFKSLIWISERPQRKAGNCSATYCGVVESMEPPILRVIYGQCVLYMRSGLGKLSEIMRNRSHRIV